MAEQVGEDLCRTASGVDISDGILAATVLEHSPESHQSSSPKGSAVICVSCETRFLVFLLPSQNAMRGWFREYAEVRRDHGIFCASNYWTSADGL